MDEEVFKAELESIKNSILEACEKAALSMGEEFLKLGYFINNLDIKETTPFINSKTMGSGKKFWIEIGFRAPAGVSDAQRCHPMDIIKSAVKNFRLGLDGRFIKTSVDFIYVERNSLIFGGSCKYFRLPTKNFIV